jgi:hypothetical protein
MARSWWSLNKSDTHVHARVYGVRSCLWTASTNGPIVHSPDDTWVWRDTVECYWQGKTEEVGENPVLVLLCPLHIPHGLSRVRIRASSVRGQRLTAWAMARPEHVRCDFAAVSTLLDRLPERDTLLSHGKSSIVFNGFCYKFVHTNSKYLRSVRTASSFYWSLMSILQEPG